MCVHFCSQDCRQWPWESKPPHLELAKLGNTQSDRRCWLLVYGCDSRCSRNKGQRTDESCPPQNVDITQQTPISGTEPRILKELQDTSTFHKNPEFLLAKISAGFFQSIGTSQCMLRYHLRTPFASWKGCMEGEPRKAEWDPFFFSTFPALGHD